VAHLAENGPDALFGQAGLALPFALQALEPLHRGKKSRRFRFAV
jgi:hypothetical protein